MKRKTVTKQQHFVPTMYLKRWPSAFLIRQNKAVSSRDVCKTNYFYASREEQLASGLDLEAFLANSVEGASTPSSAVSWTGVSTRVRVRMC